MKMKTKDCYVSKDLAESAYLVASNAKLIHIENKEGICWFTFSDASSCQALVNSYWCGEAMVNARAFSSAMRMLKDAIYRGRKQ